MSLRTVGQFLSIIVVQALLLGLLALIVPGFRFEDPVTLVPMALIITIGQSVLWPLVYAVAARVSPWRISGRWRWPPTP